MIELFSNLTYWHWLIFGVALIAMETLIPGAFFLWPGLAAILMGVLTLIIPGLSWTTTLTLWACLSLLTLTAWIFYRRKHPSQSGSNTLNRRGQELVGQELTLASPVINGKGEIKAGDTIWRVVSATDLPAGISVKVVAIEGTSLRIESA